MTTIALVVALLVVLLLVALVLLIFVGARIVYLATRLGAFRTVLHIPGQTGWRRGYARYGQRNLAWNPLVALRFSPGILLPRTSLEVLGVSHTPEAGTTLMRLRSGDAEYQLILSTGDYTGLVSWVDSAPPQETALF